MTNNEKKTTSKEVFNINTSFIPRADDLVLDLNPWMSTKTLYFHIKEHLRNYGEKSKSLLEEDLNNKGVYTKCYSITDIIKKAHQMMETTENTEEKEIHKNIYHNVTQFYNHEFFFHCLGSGKGKTTFLDQCIKNSFGSYKEMIELMLKESQNIFAGYIWFLREKGSKKLTIFSTPEAESICVLFPNHFPVFTIDLWEHAYYLDYQNKKTEYIINVLESIVHWQFVEKRIGEDNYNMYDLLDNESI